MLSLEEISDRLEINDLLVRYSHHLDRGDWDGLRREVFTPDAVIDYSELGGSVGDLEETLAFLSSAMPMFKSYQHLVANSVVEIDGDEATARTICFNPMVFEKPGGDEHVFYCGLWYVDRLVRTPEGWRIAARREERSYVDNMPTDLAPPAE